MKRISFPIWIFVFTLIYTKVKILPLNVNKNIFMFNLYVSYGHILIEIHIFSKELWMHSTIWGNSTCTKSKWKHVWPPVKLRSLELLLGVSWSGTRCSGLSICSGSKIKWQEYKTTIFIRPQFQQLDEKGERKYPT